MDASKIPGLFMLGLMAMALVILPVIGRKIMNRRRIRADADWKALAERFGLAHRGAFPACRLDGTVDGIAISIRHEVQYGSKAGASYSLSGWAQPVTRLGPVTLKRAGFFSRLARRNAQRGIASGELSVAEDASASGRLSAATGPGALSEAAPQDRGIEAPSRHSGLSQEEESELDASFARAFDGIPPGVSIPPYVKAALLGDPRMTLTNGQIEFESRDQTNADHAEKILIELVKLARAFE